MRCLIFIETNDGKIYYKCDSFWSKSENMKYAKVYREADQTQMDNWITTYDYNIHEELKRTPSRLDDIYKRYHQCKMGYRTVEDRFLNDGHFSVKEDTKGEDLDSLIYTHQVHINGLEKPKIFDIRKAREEKLNEILK